MRIFVAILSQLITITGLAQSLSSDMIPDQLLFEHGSENCIFFSDAIEEDLLDGITLLLENYSVGEGNTTGTTVSISSEGENWELVRTTTTSEQVSQFSLLDDELVRTERITWSLPNEFIVDQTFNNRTFFRFPMEINQTVTNDIEVFFAWEYTFIGYTDIQTPFYNYEHLVVMERTMYEWLDNEFVPSAIGYDLYLDSNLIYPVFSTFTSSQPNSIYFIHHIGMLPQLIEERAAVSSINVFPNPANDIISVHFRPYPSYENVQMTLLDMHGKTLKSEFISNPQGHYVIPVNHLPTGLYLIRVTSNTAIETKRVVIQ